MPRTRGRRRHDTARRRPAGTTPGGPVPLRGALPAPVPAPVPGRYAGATRPPRPRRARVGDFRRAPPGLSLSPARLRPPSSESRLLLTRPSEWTGRAEGSVLIGEKGFTCPPPGRALWPRSSLGRGWRPSSRQSEAGACSRRVAAPGFLLQGATASALGSLVGDVGQECRARRRKRDGVWR